MRRLFDDPELPAELRDDLLRSRAAGQQYPTSAKLLQLRAALSDPARQPLGTLTERGIRLLGHPGWKLLVLAAVGGGATWLARPMLAPPTKAVVAPSSVLKPQPVVTAVSQPSPLAQPAAGVAEVAVPVQAEPGVLAPAAANGGEPSSRGRAKVEQSSRREIAQLLRIRATLEHDPAAAYRLAQRSEREFPHGVLSEEREALSIVALAKGGSREQAQARARAFFTRYPESTMRELVLAGLGK